VWAAVAMVIAERPVQRQPVAASAAVVARLDTRGIRSQISAGFQHPKPESLASETLRDNDQAAKAKRERKQKAHYHAELVRCLESMAAGDHGLVAQALANKVLPDVKKCPGNVRRHKACGELSFHGSKCDYPLCPWCQGRRSRRLRSRILPAVEAMASPKLWTFSPPNIGELTSASVSALQGALAQLHRLVFLKGSKSRVETCVGGFRSIEITNKGNGWNLHCHELVDSGWVAHYPQTDIEPRRDRKRDWVWAVTARHPGLAREFTRVCQNYAELREIGHCLAGRHEGFEIDCPDCWYFVDMRAAKVSAVAEIAKYVVKGSQVVKAGPAAVVEYYMAMKGKQSFKGFGKYYGFKVDGLEDTEKSQGPDVSMCPWPECPDPTEQAWEFVAKGKPAGYRFGWDSWAKASRVVQDSG